MDELDELIIKIYELRGMKIRNIDWQKNESELWDEEILPPNVNAHPGWWTMCTAPQDYPRDIAAAWELESEVESAGRILGPEQSRYVRHLLRVLGIEYRRDGEDNVLTCDEDLWAITHATPEQKCRAYLAWKQEAQP
jgi:hypothetical protein